jgi:hypothetical protein
MSTAFHPQADDQQGDWAELFPLAEHAYNTAVSETTKTSPFFGNYGYQPETQCIRPAASEARDCYRALPGVTDPRTTPKREREAHGILAVLERLPT